MATQTRENKTETTAKAPKIEIQSEDDLNEVLAHLAKYSSKRRALKSELDRAIAALAQKHAAKFHVDFYGETYHIDALLNALNNAGVAWAMEHREALLGDGKKKSKKLPNGTVAFAVKPNSGGLKFMEGQTNSGVVERLAERFKLVDAFLNLLRSLRLRGKGKSAVTLDRVLKVECVVDLDRVKIHHEKGELADCDLAEIGVELREPEETCKLKPFESNAE